jgi:hypothetical protein
LEGLGVLMFDIMSVGVRWWFRISLWTVVKFARQMVAFGDGLYT